MATLNKVFTNTSFACINAHNKKAQTKMTKEETAFYNKLVTRKHNPIELLLKK